MKASSSIKNENRLINRGKLNAFIHIYILKPLLLTNLTFTSKEKNKQTIKQKNPLIPKKRILKIKQTLLKQYPFLEPFVLAPEEKRVYGKLYNLP